MSRKKVIVSACLLGENCRYDGKTKKVPLIEEIFSEYEVIPFCPEAPLFGTPRARINIVEIEGENRVFQEKTGKDVTILLQKEIETFINQHRDIDKIVLKSKSPSCGFQTTPIYNMQKKQIATGNGIAAEIFSNVYDVSIEDELSIL